MPKIGIIAAMEREIAGLVRSWRSGYIESRASIEEVNRFSSSALSGMVEGSAFPLNARGLIFA